MLVGWFIMGIDIKKAFKTVSDALKGIQGVALIAVIGVIVIGSIIGAVTDGSISLPTNFNTTLSGFDETMSGWFTSGTAVITTIVALIVVVVLIALFSSKKGKGGSGDMA